MTKVLVTGATGNVGIEVLYALKKMGNPLDIYAGVRNTEAEMDKLSEFNITPVKFDFMDILTFLPALKGMDVLFLLRPPQISDVKKYFAPLIETALQTGTKHIVFLSVQGVEKSEVIPHHKIEKLIVDSKIPYTFLRPAYFMQNFTTTLRNDLVHKKRIYLPAGNAKFTLIDVRDIGTVAAQILTNVSQHINQSYELTCNQKLTFSEMASVLSQGLGTDIQYTSPNLLSFFLTKRKEKVPTMLILVMIMLHYLPRFQKEPETTNWVQKITNVEPTTFEQFIQYNKKALTPLASLVH
jgi:uncharacterized protein YbjT (DUF2867 family)